MTFCQCHFMFFMKSDSVMVRGRTSNSKTSSRQKFVPPKLRPDKASTYQKLHPKKIICIFH
uniref:Uncharacterized protein n=1 Tax=Meloidogyne enterolobii TaxID=390850 RepID=A0A6V7VS15_MELEN|nr:unnamed protein product [Meloidogyne enterolobii]